jgi:CRISPR-associated exonuclease Cas4
MYAEDDLLPISALQHLLFCERQCALIHVEHVWAENRLTLEGRHLHRRAHEESTSRRHDVHTARGLAVRSLRLGLAGRADVVEFSPVDDVAREHTSRRKPPQRILAGGQWRVVPIEYKRGKPKKDNSDRVQLCAQALCLEEMLGLLIPSGRLFYGRQRCRTSVEFDAPLRELTAATAARLHELISSRRTPLARRQPKCDQCSLLPACLPDSMADGDRMQKRINRVFQHHLKAAAPATDRDS